MLMGGEQGEGICVHVPEDGVSQEDGESDPGGGPAVRPGGSQVQQAEQGDRENHKGILRQRPVEVAVQQAVDGPRRSAPRTIESRRPMDRARGKQPAARGIDEIQNDKHAGKQNTARQCPADGRRSSGDPQNPDPASAATPMMIKMRYSTPTAKPQPKDHHANVLALLDAFSAP